MKMEPLAQAFVTVFLVLFIAALFVVLPDWNGDYNTTPGILGQTLQKWGYVW